jgi:hypothetical protein
MNKILSRQAFLRQAGLALLGLLLVTTSEAQVRPRVPQVPPSEMKSPLGPEALTFATDHVKSHLMRCKDGMFLKVQQWGGNSYYPYFYQLLEPNVAVQPLRAISDVDRLNRLEWAGRLIIVAKAVRYVGAEDFKPSWAPWIDPMTTTFGGHEFGGLWIDLRKSNGQWELASDLKRVELMAPMDCSAIPARP